MVPHVRSPKLSGTVEKLGLLAMELGPALYCWTDIGSLAFETHIWTSNSTHIAAAEKKAESHTRLCRACPSILPDVVG
jgi:hypothetical protein